MTSKHFEAIALSLCVIRDLKDRKGAAALLIPVLKESNEKFDEAKFLVACGLMLDQSELGL